MKIKNKKFIYGFIVLGFGFILREMYFAIVYLYNITLKRNNKSAMMKLLDVNDEARIVLKDFEEEKIKIKTWLDNTLVEGIKIKGYKNTPLFAEWFKNNSNRWVIVLHGYGANGRFMYEVGKKFYKKGYNVLIPDLRGHGISGGDYIGMGWHDRKDLALWIKHIKKIDKNCKIVLYGVSMGASTILMASGDKMDKNVKCIISDCAYTCAYDVFKYQFGKTKKTPIVLLKFLNLVCIFKNGYSLKNASSIKQLKNNKLPILFIHGAVDNFVPTTMVFDLYKNARCEKELMIVNNAGHLVSEIIERKRYWNRISLFLNKYC